MVKFCPTCNRSSEDVRFIGEFCQNCVLKKIIPLIPEKMTIQQCRFCNRIVVANTFTELNKRSLADALEKEIKDCKCRVKVLSRDDKTAKLELECYLDDGTVKFEKSVEIKIAHKTCLRCYRISSGYYEAIVQVRGNKERVEKFVKKLSTYMVHMGTFVTKVDTVTNGFDVYLGDKALANQFFLYHKMKPKRSFRLYGKRGGKDLYRNIYAIYL